MNRRESTDKESAAEADGLTNMVTDEEIGSVLQAESHPERACRRLAARANEEGARTISLSSSSVLGPSVC
jgi:hypothetical protein